MEMIKDLLQTVSERPFTLVERSFPDGTDNSRTGDCPPGESWKIAGDVGLSSSTDDNGTASETGKIISVQSSRIWRSFDVPDARLAVSAMTLQGSPEDLLDCGIL